MEKNETKLIEGIRKSDLVAFRDFFDCYYQAIFNFALRYVPDLEESKDIVQDSFISFWENRRKIKSVNTGKALLYKITKNHCLNFIKREAVKSRYTDQSLFEIKTIELGYTDSVNPVFSRLRDKELEDKLNAALNQLPADRKRIFELSRFDGMKNAEIAKKLNLSVRTVDTQIYRAVKALKEQLKELF